MDRLAGLQDDTRHTLSYSFFKKNGELPVKTRRKLLIIEELRCPASGVGQWWDTWDSGTPRYCRK